MVKTKRPRVAAIGLTDVQVKSIESLCGELRSAESLDYYLREFNWTETDIVVLSASYVSKVDSSVNLVTLGIHLLQWDDSYFDGISRHAHGVATNTNNTERELSVPTTCPELYKSLADELREHLVRAEEPPDTIDNTRRDETAILIETTSGYPVASRVILPPRSETVDREQSRAIALLLPEESNLAAWFRVFLCDIHESDPTRVPQAPPRLSAPSDWYTPKERVLAERIVETESGIVRLSNERDRLQRKLADEGEKADQGPRRALWADGDDLADAVNDLLTELGFEVRDMDAELKQGEPKREDLRLTLQGDPGWEAIVEVKGYTGGTRRNDSRQIREHRDRYIGEKGRPPNLTVWLANPHRNVDDPSLRPRPSRDIGDAADNVGAVHVLASDLYQQWALVTAETLEADTVVQSLKSAEPGLWIPPTAGSKT